MSEAASLRRYYVLERLATTQAGMLAVAAVWRAKQESAPAGVALPVDFPSFDQLTAVGYVASEDLVGADAQELADYAGLSALDSSAALAALQAL